MNCHSPEYVGNLHAQYDAGVVMFNEKFGKPAGELMDQLSEVDMIDSIPFNEHIEWVYFYLWHHEGRRARHGLAMMGPDYVQWHGFYEVAERFYMEFIPETERLLPGVSEEIMGRTEHKWMTTPLSEEERERMTRFYEVEAQ